MNKQKEVENKTKPCSLSLLLSLGSSAWLGLWLYVKSHWPSGICKGNARLTWKKWPLVISAMGWFWNFWVNCFILLSPGAGPYALLSVLMWRDVLMHRLLDVRTSTSRTNVTNVCLSGELTFSSKPFTHHTYFPQYPWHNSLDRESCPLPHLLVWPLKDATKTNS